MKKILHAIFNNLLIVRLCSFIKSVYDYFIVYFRLKDNFYNGGFKTLAKRYIGINLKKDWIGRFYGVINPIIKDGKLDPSNMIIEIDDDKTNSSEYVKTWLHRQLYLMRELFNLSNLYDYITVEIRHVGPIELDNYLVIFDIAERKDMSKKFKRVVKQTLVYAIIFLIGFFIFF